MYYPLRCKSSEDHRWMFYTTLPLSPIPPVSYRARYWSITDICAVISGTAYLTHVDPGGPAVYGRGFAAARLLGLGVRIPPWAWMSVVNAVMLYR
jgi:hypothetical protein